MRLPLTLSLYLARQFTLAVLLAGSLLASGPVAYVLLSALFKRGQADTLTHDLPTVSHD